MTVRYKIPFFLGMLAFLATGSLNAKPLSVRGPVYKIDTKLQKIMIVPAGPFWGPNENGGADWPIIGGPKPTLALSVNSSTIFTLNGRRVTFAQLAVGQTVSAEYTPSRIGVHVVAQASRLDATSKSKIPASKPR